MSGGTASTVAVYMTVGFAANALLGFFVLSRDEKAPANRLYAGFVFLVAWWALAKLGVSLSGDADTAAVWYKLSAFGWLLMPPVYLQFVGEYTSRRIFGAATRRRGATRCRDAVRTATDRWSEAGIRTAPRPSS